MARDRTDLNAKYNVPVVWDLYDSFSLILEYKSWNIRLTVWSLDKVELYLLAGLQGDAEPNMGLGGFRPSKV